MPSSAILYFSISLSPSRHDLIFQMCEIMQQFERLAGRPYSVVGEVVSALTSISADLNVCAKEIVFSF